MSERRQPDMRVKVKIVRHSRTGLIVGMSDDLPGLMIAGRTEAQVRAETPGAIREVLEAQGKRGVHVFNAEDGQLPKAFLASGVTADVEFESAL